jgi:hypothetical protein
MDSGMGKIYFEVPEGEGGRFYSLLKVGLAKVALDDRSLSARNATNTTA